MLLRQPKQGAQKQSQLKKIDKRKNACTFSRRHFIYSSYFNEIVKIKIKN